MSQYAIPTVLIKSNNEYGSLRINESDFDPEKHELYKPEAEAEAEAEQPKKPRASKAK